MCVCVCVRVCDTEHRLSNRVSLYLDGYSLSIPTAIAPQVSAVGFVGYVNTYNQHTDRNWQTVVAR
jgi:hypothetical protein